jgi:hypothetical protein
LNVVKPGASGVRWAGTLGLCDADAWDRPRRARYNQALSAQQAKRMLDDTGLREVEDAVR